MKDDEKRMLVSMFERRPKPLKGCEMATAIGTDLGIHPKRADYILEKWIDKGWWECGVSARTGWFTEKGLTAAKESKGCE